MKVDVVTFDLPAPDDLSRLETALVDIDPARSQSIALFLRVPGEYHDGARERARATVARLLTEQGLASRAEYVTVIGCEGVSTPSGFALVRRPDEGAAAGDDPRLAIGLAAGGDPDERALGTMAHVVATRDATVRALADGGLRPAEVEAVIVNAPQPDSGDVAIRARRARAAAALGAGAAIGEVNLDRLSERDIVANDSIHTRRVHTFTGPGIDRTGVIAIGNARGATGDLRACHASLADAFDTRALKRSLLAAGLSLDEWGEVADPSRVVATIAKFGASADGSFRGAPTTILGSATPPEKHVRAAMSGVLGAVLQTSRVFGTFDPIQQAPPGGAIVCCVLRAP